MNHPARGMSRLELLVVLVLLLVFAGVLLHRLREVQREAERIAVVAVLDTLRAGLWLEVAARVGKAGDGDISALAVENPFPRLLGAVPAYVGVVPDNLQEMRGGGWYFDEKRARILYQPRFSENFFTSVVMSNGVEFTIVAVYQQSPLSSRVFEGLRITGQCECVWLPKQYTASSAGR